MIPRFLRLSSSRYIKHFMATDPSEITNLYRLPSTQFDSHHLLPGKYFIDIKWKGTHPVSGKLQIPPVKVDQWAATNYLVYALSALTMGQLSRDEIYALLRSKAVKINKRICTNPWTMVRYKDRIQMQWTMPMDLRRITLHPSHVLEQTDDFIVASKPAGLLLRRAMHNAGFVELLQELLCVHRDSDKGRCTPAVLPPDLLHSSGLCLFSSTPKAHLSFRVMHQYKFTLRQKYLVVVKFINASRSWPFDSPTTTLDTPLSLVQLPHSVVRHRLTPDLEAGSPCTTEITLLADATVNGQRIGLLQVEPTSFAFSRAWIAQLALKGMVLWQPAAAKVPDAVGDSVAFRSDREEHAAVDVAGAVAPAHAPFGSAVTDGSSDPLPQPVASSEGARCPILLHSHCVQWDPFIAFSGRQIGCAPPASWCVCALSCLGPWPVVSPRRIVHSVVRLLSLSRDRSSLLPASFQAPLESVMSSIRTLHPAPRPFDRSSYHPM